MNKYDEMVVRITIFCREPLNFGLFHGPIRLLFEYDAPMDLWFYTFGAPDVILWFKGLPGSPLCPNLGTWGQFRRPLKRVMIPKDMVCY